MGRNRRRRPTQPRPPEQPRQDRRALHPLAFRAPLGRRREEPIITIGIVPSYLQNASHSASVFRIAQSAPFATGGILASNELPVSQQSSPNMSLILGPGRAQIVGTSVSPPSGQAWTTQAQYTAYNDANLTLTIATSNPTNPRIDSVYVQIQDSFYSGATNTAVAAVATGTPAVSPVAPSIPANSILIANIAVAANATTIVTANISYQAVVATILGVVRSHSEWTYSAAAVPNAALTVLAATPAVSAGVSSSNYATYWTTAAGGFTVGVSGIYSITFTASLGVASTGRTFLSIINGSGGVEYRGGSTQVEDVLMETAEFYATAGQVISFEFFQTTGAARTITGRINMSFRPLN